MDSIEREEQDFVLYASEKLLFPNLWTDKHLVCYNQLMTV